MSSQTPWKETSLATFLATCQARAAERLKGLGIVDKVISEPLGGAHRKPASTAASLREELTAQLDMLKGLDTEALLTRRYERLMSYGIA